MALSMLHAGFPSALRDDLRRRMDAVEWNGEAYRVLAFAWKRASAAADRLATLDATIAAKQEERARLVNTLPSTLLDARFK